MTGTVINWKSIPKAMFSHELKFNKKLKGNDQPAGFKKNRPFIKMRGQNIWRLFL
jgi:hypothetical protein